MRNLHYDEQNIPYSSIACKSDKVQCNFDKLKKDIMHLDHKFLNSFS